MCDLTGYNFTGLGVDSGIRLGRLLRLIPRGSLLVLLVG